MQGHLWREGATSLPFPLKTAAETTLSTSAGRPQCCRQCDSQFTGRHLRSNSRERMAQVLHVPAPFPGQGHGGRGEGSALEVLNGEDTVTVWGRSALM